MFLYTISAFGIALILKYTHVQCQRSIYLFVSSDQPWFPNKSMFYDGGHRHNMAFLSKSIVLNKDQMNKVTEI